MTWLKVSIAAEEVAKGLHIHLQEKFQMVAGRMRVKDVAMLGSEDATGACVCYFSPACLALVGDFLRARGAVECEPPSRKTVRLLAGGAEILDSLPE